MKTDIEMKLAAASLGALAALLAGASTAQADPGGPVPPPAPPAVVAPVPPGPAPAAPPAQPVVAAAPVAEPAPPAEVPHLASPENLPPGTSMTRQEINGGSGSYLRELWHAVQTQEVSGKDALLLLTQRPMNTNATPPSAPGEPLPPAAVPPPAPGPVAPAP